MYSQGNEEIEIAKYFNDYKGTLLSLGENNGQFLSNALGLIENGWKALLLEPATNAYNELRNLHINNNDVVCLNFAISDYCGKAIFYDSGTHLGKGDKSLLSSLNKNEITKWLPTTTFEQDTVEVIDVDRLLKISPFKIFEFISVDCEGEDLKILRQMDLVKLGCRLICIEHNGNEQVFEEIKTICNKAGLNNMILKNGENVLWSI
jgi:FkbM family methyltransferase